MINKKHIVTVSFTILLFILMSYCLLVINSDGIYIRSEWPTIPLPSWAQRVKVKFVQYTPEKDFFFRKNKLPMIELSFYNKSYSQKQIFDKLKNHLEQLGFKLNRNPDLLKESIIAVDFLKDDLGVGVIIKPSSGKEKEITYTIFMPENSPLIPDP